MKVLNEIPKFNGKDSMDVYYRRYYKEGTHVRSCCYITHVIGIGKHKTFIIGDRIYYRFI